MAGNKKKAADLVLLDQVGQDKVEDLLEKGLPIAQICIELKVGKRALYQWLEAPERAALLTRARARAADHLAAETLEIADQVDADQAEIQRAKLRTDVRRWLAGKWDPARYGEQRGVAVQVNIGDLHLDALRAQRGSNAVIDVTPVDGVTEQATGDD